MQFFQPQRSDILWDNYLASGHEYNADGTSHRLTVKLAFSLLAVNSRHHLWYVISCGCIIRMQHRLFCRLCVRGTELSAFLLWNHSLSFTHCPVATKTRQSIHDGRPLFVVWTALWHYSNAFITAIKTLHVGDITDSQILAVSSSLHRHWFGCPSLRLRG